MSKLVHAVPASAALCLFAAFGQAPVSAADLSSSDMASCVSLKADTERLACYDGLAGRAAVPAPGESASAPVPVAPAPVRGPTPVGEGLHPADGGGDFLSRFWELDPEDKRGTFNFTGYRPNYLLPVHVTSHLNSQPQSPTHPATTLTGYRNLEAKFQLSLRTKVIQDFLLPDGDLWFGYTQQSLWQVWNQRESSPFRSTDYQPEMMYVAPTPKAVRYLPYGWQWRYVQLGIVHQSNGQTDPLSRSWNRVYFGTGFEHGDVSLTARFTSRLSEKASIDDNPDIADYVGRSDFILAWTPGLATASLTYRNTLRSFHRGSIQFDWTYPVRIDHPNGLRWYVQGFSGYGESLIDYNSRQSSMGLGLSLFNF